jgi:hypothetical protein
LHKAQQQFQFRNRSDQKREHQNERRWSVLLFVAGRCFPGDPVICECCAVRCGAVLRLQMAHCMCGSSLYILLL